MLHIDPIERKKKLPYEVPCGNIQLSKVSKVMLVNHDWKTTHCPYTFFPVVYITVSYCHKESFMHQVSPFCIYC